MQTHKRTRLAAWPVTALAPAAVGLSTVASEKVLIQLAEQKASDQDRQIATADRTACRPDVGTVGEYRLALQKLDRVKIYNGHLQTLVNDQEGEGQHPAAVQDFQVVQTDIVP